MAVSLGSRLVLSSVTFRPRVNIWSEVIFSVVLPRFCNRMSAVFFDFLSKEVLPQFVAKGGRNIKIWSAACSSGEELYTISIVLNEFIERNPQLSFSLLGTDISSNVLDKAVHGVYGEKSIEGIPLMLKKKYFLKSKD